MRSFIFLLAKPSNFTVLYTFFCFHVLFFQTSFMSLSMVSDSREATIHCSELFDTIDGCSELFDTIDIDHNSAVAFKWTNSGKGLFRKNSGKFFLPQRCVKLGCFAVAPQKFDCCYSQGK